MVPVKLRCRSLVFLSPWGLPVPGSGKRVGLVGGDSKGGLEVYHRAPAASKVDKPWGWHGISLTSMESIVHLEVGSFGLIYAGW